MTKRLALTISVMALVMTGSMNVAVAQDDGDDVKGIQAGALTIRPSLTVTEIFDDNIYTEENNENDDFITRVKPQVIIDAADKPNIFRLTAGLTQEFYGDDSDDDRLDYNVGVRGRTKFQDNVQWDGMADFRKLHSDRGDDETNPANDAKEPPEYNVGRVTTSLEAKHDTLTFKPRLGLTHYNFEDYSRTNNTLVDQDVRDRNEYGFGGRISHNISGETSVFVDGEFQPRNYSDSTATRRDSDGGSYLAGVRYEGSAVKAELALGYMDREYDVAVYEEIDALDAEASLDWSIDSATQFKASVGRNIAEVTDANVGGAVRTDFRTSLSHDFTEQWEGRLKARYRTSDYQGGNGASSGTSDREDDFVEAGAALDYKLSERITFTADYTYGNNDSNLNTADYDRNVFMLGVKLEY